MLSRIISNLDSPYQAFAILKDHENNFLLATSIFNCSAWEESKRTMHLWAKQNNKVGLPIPNSHLDGSHPFSAVHWLRAFYRFFSEHGLLKNPVQPLIRSNSGQTSSLDELHLWFCTEVSPYILLASSLFLADRVNVRHMKRFSKNITQVLKHHWV